jgi:predicted O-methyltransferase YrrM
MSRPVKELRASPVGRLVTILRVDGPRAFCTAARRGLGVRAQRFRNLLLPRPPRVMDRALQPPPELWRPPGHFYSPVVSVTEVEADAERIWIQPAPQELPGIDLRFDYQVEVLHTLAKYHDELPPYGPKAIDGYRFRTENRMYGLADAGLLYAYMRHRQPRRIIEVGSGFSSAVMLDTAEHFLDDPPALTFIEPYPDRLHSVLREGDRQRVDIVARRVQDVDVELFDELASSDILVIDSSHVVKTGSDVNHLYFEVLPRLAPGVLVHVHDIGFPFEYPRSWVTEGRSWNEAYLLRALLMFSDEFRIDLWNGSLRTHRPDAFAACPNFRGGSQIWIGRTGDLDS